MMYILVFYIFQGTDATVFPNASCNDVHFCLSFFQGTDATVPGTGYRVPVPRIFWNISCSLLKNLELIKLPLGGAQSSDLL